MWHFNLFFIKKFKRKCSNLSKKINFDKMRKSLNWAESRSKNVCPLIWFVPSRPGSSLFSMNKLRRPCRLACGSKLFTHKLIKSDFSKSIVKFTEIIIIENQKIPPYFIEEVKPQASLVDLSTCKSQNIMKSHTPNGQEAPCQFHKRSTSASTEPGRFRNYFLQQHLVWIYQLAASKLVFKVPLTSSN